MATRAAMRTTLLVELSDNSDFDTDELNRAIEQAVEELSKFYPLNSVQEYLFNKTITDEAFTSSYDVAVSLANNPIRPRSEVVTTTDGLTTYTRDTDYEMDYIAGTITVLSTGSMADATGYEIDYHNDDVLIDISSLLTNPIRVHRVEYRIGESPQVFPSFDIIGDYLMLTTDGVRSSQSRLPDNAIVRIFYEAFHTAPTDSVNGSFPRFLDDVIVKGAAGFALRIKALEQRLATISDLASAGTELGLVQAVIDEVEDIIQTDPVSVISVVDEGRAILGAISFSIGAFNDGLADLGELDTVLPALRGSAGEPVDDLMTALSKVTTHLTGVSDSAKAALDLVEPIIQGASGTGMEGPIDAGETAIATIISALDALRGTATEPFDEADALLDLVEAELTQLEGAADKIDTMIDGASDSIDDALDEVQTWVAAADTNGQGLPDIVDHIETDTENANLYLNNGDALLNQINVGGPATPQDYVAFAQTKIQMALAMRDSAFGYIELAKTKADEARVRVEAVNARFLEVQGHSQAIASYLQAVEGRLSTGRLILEEASQRAGVITQYFQVSEQRKSQIDGYFQEASLRTNMALAFVQEARGYEVAINALLGEADIRVRGALAYFADAAAEVENNRSQVQAADSYFQAAQTMVQASLAIIRKAETNQASAQLYQVNADRRRESADALLEEADRRLREFRDTIRDKTQMISTPNQAARRQI